MFLPRCHLAFALTTIHPNGERTAWLQISRDFKIHLVTDLSGSLCVSALKSKRGT